MIAQNSPKLSAWDLGEFVTIGAHSHGAQVNGIAQPMRVHREAFLIPWLNLKSVASRGARDWIPAAALGSVLNSSQPNADRMAHVRQSEIDGQPRLVFRLVDACYANGEAWALLAEAKPGPDGAHHGDDAPNNSDYVGPAGDSPFHATQHTYRDRRVKHDKGLALLLAEEESHG